MVTSSVASQTANVGRTLYPGGKSFVSKICQGVGYEESDRLDISAFEPAEVDTKMIADNKLMKARACSTFDCVTAALTDLGHHTRFNGVFKHEVTYTIVRNLPDFVIKRLLKKQYY